MRVGLCNWKLVISNASAATTYKPNFNSPAPETNILSSAGSMGPSNWTRLQTFKPHHASSQHKVAATIFIRETMPHISLHRVDSPAEDFHDLLKNIKARRVTEIRNVWQVAQIASHAVLPCRGPKEGESGALCCYTPGLHHERRRRLQVFRKVGLLHTNVAA